jgi:ketosteroid isomerase-like protein
VRSLHPSIFVLCLGSLFAALAASSDTTPPRSENELRNLATIRTQFDGFAHRDLEAVMATFAEDCVYESASGPTPQGTRFSGKPALREEFRRLFETWPTAVYQELTTIVDGDRGIAHWTVAIPGLGGGTTIAIEGIDFFDFENGKVTKKRNWLKSLAGDVGSQAATTGR